MRFLIAATLVLMIASCETPRYAYSPTAHNVPSFKKAGDTKISGSFSSNFDINETNDSYQRNRSNGYDVQAAVAATNHLAVQGSYYSRTERNYDTYSSYFDSSTINVKRTMWEAGLGFYTGLDKRNNNSFALYGGIGQGNMKLRDKGIDNSSFTPYTRFYNADLFKYYLEPSMTFRKGSVFTFSVATRLSAIRFKNIRTDYSYDERRSFDLDSLNRFTWYFFEPCIVNSFGFNKLPGFRIEYQFGLSLLLSGENSFQYRPFNFSVGLLFDIPKLIKNVPEEPVKTKERERRSRRTDW